MNLRQVGSLQEERAEAFLVSEGYEILERNFRCRQGEIDRIARDGEYLVFIEIKYRTGENAGAPEAAVTPAKQKKISKVALWYLTREGLGIYTPCRFDVVAVTPEEIRLYKDAFPFRIQH